MFVNIICNKYYLYYIDIDLYLLTARVIAFNQNYSKFYFILFRPTQLTGVPFYTLCILFFFSFSHHKLLLIIGIT